MNKRTLLYIMLLLFSGCVRWDEYPDDSETPSQPEQAALFTQIALDLIPPPWGEANMIAQHHFFCDPQNGQPNYNFKEMSLNYSHLTYVREWEALMAQTGETGKALGEALGKFFRARFFFTYSRFLGDIPMYEALQADLSLFTPAYDTQKQIMLQALKWQDEANATLHQLPLTSLQIKGDPFFDGNPVAWQKVINSWTIRILINLLKRQDDPDLQLAQHLQKIISHPEVYPFIISLQDNMTVRWPGTSFYKYPLYFSAVYPEIQQRRFPLASTFVDLMKAYEDPRLPIIAQPIPQQTGPDHTYDFAAYRGGIIGLLKEDLYQMVNAGQISYFNPERYYTPQGESTIVIGAAEMMFCLAEAANRELIPGDAEQYYQTGIRFSFEYYSLLPADARSIEYLQKVRYRGNTNSGLQQILEQKYLAFFQNSGYEAFFDQRRTGIPHFTTGPQNLNDQKIPKRWRYPEQEYQTNRAHVLEAVRRQYNGTDDINAKMWIIL